MIADTRHRPAGLRSSSLGTFDVGAVLRRLDWLLLLAVATLAFSLASGIELLALARLAQGVAAGLVWTAGIAAISARTS